MPLQITPLPTPAPTRSDPTNFPPRADALVSALPTFVGEVNAVAAEMEANRVLTQTGASTATTQASAAASSAAAAQASAQSALSSAGTNATSASSLTVGTGSRTFVIQTGKAFTVGQIMLAAAAAAGNWMIGQVTAHDAVVGSITLNVTATAGSGTHASWTLSPTAPQTRPQAVVLTVANNGQTLASNSVYALDVSGGPFTVNLPASPAVDDRIAFMPQAGDLRLNPVTLGRNGRLTPNDSNSAGVAEDLIVDDNMPFELVERGTSAGGWRYV